MLAIITSVLPSGKTKTVVGKVISNGAMKVQAVVTRNGGSTAIKTFSKDKYKITIVEDGGRVL